MLLFCLRVCVCVCVSSDIDECAEGLIECHNHSRCVNLPGWYHCECRSGFHDNGSYLLDGSSCIGEHTLNCKHPFHCSKYQLLRLSVFEPHAHHQLQTTSLSLFLLLCPITQDFWTLPLPVFLFKSLSSLVSYMIAWLSYLSHLSYFEICDGCMSASSNMSPSRITRRLIRGLPTFTARDLSTRSDSHTQPIMRNSWGTHISPVLPLDVCAVCLLSHVLARIDRQPESKIEKHQAYVFLVSGNSVDDIRRGEYSVRPDFKVTFTYKSWKNILSDRVNGLMR